MELKKIKAFVKKHLVVLLTSLGVFLILLAVVFLVFFMQKNVAQYTIEKAKTYLYFDQAKFEYDTTLTLDRSSGITKLKFDKEEVDLTSQPLYWTGLKKALFPTEMAVVFPLLNGMQKKVSSFSIVDASDSDMAIKNQGMDYPLEHGFLYDGNDLYFFLEEVTLSIGPDYQIVLPAFSYAIYNFNKELYFYHYDEDRMYYLADVSETVTASTDSYTVNLSIDSLDYKEKSRLLMKNFSYLSKLK